MRKFKDSNDHEHQVHITVRTVQEIKDELGLDLLQFAEGEDTFRRLASDPVLLVNALWICCRNAAQEGMTDEMFGRSLAGDSLQAAVDAFLEELVGFFPRPEVRRNLGEVLKRTRQVEIANGQRIERLLGEGVLEKRMTEEFEKQLETLGLSSGEPPVSSGSTPGP